MPAQGTKHHSALAVWLNRVGMTSREFKRRVGSTSTSGLAALLDGSRCPALAVALEIERITEGGVPVESWAASVECRNLLKHVRAKQPEEYQPKREVKAHARKFDDEDEADDD